MRFALFRDITQRRVVILYRRSGTTYRSHSQGSRSRVLLTVEDGTDTSYRNVGRGFQLDANIPEERRSYCVIKFFVTQTFRMHVISAMAAAFCCSSRVLGPLLQTLQLMFAAALAELCLCISAMAAAFCCSSQVFVSTGTSKREIKVPE